MKLGTYCVVLGQRSVWEGSANENPAGLGAFAYNLRFPRQVFDGQAALAATWKATAEPRGFHAEHFISASIAAYS
jgi:hypothetical protein